MENTRKEVLAKKISDAVNENEALCIALASAEDAAAAKKVLNENGFDVSTEDVEAIFQDGLNAILKFKESAPDELSEGQLENVAGGGFFRGMFRTAASAATGFGFGMLCGVCPAAASATPYVVGGLAAWSAAGFRR